MRNDEIAQLFDEMADLSLLKGGQDFRARAYRNTARALRGLDRSAAEIVENGGDLTAIEDIGKSNAGKIREILDTGTCEKLEGLRKEIPSGLLDVLRVPDVGPATARRLYHELGVDGLESLREAVK